MQRNLVKKTRFSIKARKALRLTGSTQLCYNQGVRGSRATRDGAGGRAGVPADPAANQLKCHGCNARPIHY